MINACGIIGTEEDRIFFCLIVFKLNVRDQAGERDSGGGQSTKKTERSPRRDAGGGGGGDSLTIAVSFAAH